MYTKFTRLGVPSGLMRLVPFKKIKERRRTGTCAVLSSSRKVRKVDSLFTEVTAMKMYIVMTVAVVLLMKEASAYTGRKIDWKLTVKIENIVAIMFICIRTAA